MWLRRPRRKHPFLSRDYPCIHPSSQCRLLVRLHRPSKSIHRVADGRNFRTSSRGTGMHLHGRVLCLPTVLLARSRGTSMRTDKRWQSCGAKLMFPSNASSSPRTNVPLTSLLEMTSLALVALTEVSLVSRKVGTGRVLCAADWNSKSKCVDFLLTQGRVEFHRRIDPSTFEESPCSRPVLSGRPYPENTSIELSEKYVRSCHEPNATARQLHHQ